MGTFMTTNQMVIPNDPDDPKGAFSWNCPIDEKMNTLILLNRGRMTIRDCTLSLHFLQRSTETPLPAIILNNETESNLDNLDIKGNQMNPTVGIIVRNCHTVIKECRINKHLKGAILIAGDSTNAIKVNGCKFYKNSFANIEVTGMGCKPVIEQNIIFESEGTGITVNVGASPKIVSNLIKKAKIGIEVVSAEPIIFKNKIELSAEDGILTRTYKS